MCDGCDRFGQEGDYWYFNPENYARRIYKWRKLDAEQTGAGEKAGAALKTAQPSFSARIGLINSQALGSCREYSLKTQPMGLVPIIESMLSVPMTLKIDPFCNSIIIS